MLTATRATVVTRNVCGVEQMLLWHNSSRQPLSYGLYAYSVVYLVVCFIVAFADASIIFTPINNFFAEWSKNRVPMRLLFQYEKISCRWSAVKARGLIDSPYYCISIFIITTSSIFVRSVAFPAYVINVTMDQEPIDERFNTYFCILLNIA